MTFACSVVPFLKEQHFDFCCSFFKRNGTVVCLLSIFQRNNIFLISVVPFPKEQNFFIFCCSFFKGTTFLVASVPFSKGTTFRVFCCPFPREYNFFLLFLFQRNGIGVFFCSFFKRNDICTFDIYAPLLFLFPKGTPLA